MFCLIGIGVSLLPAFSPGATAADPPETLSPGEISRLFHEANRFFSEGNKQAVSDPRKAKALYEKAILRFERIIKDGGITNGKLYYNIGNSYFRTGDIGRAILNYRRAEIYIGNDINLQKNLEFARNTRTDQIEEKQETKILKTVFFWHYDLSSKVRLILFTILFGLMWTFAVARIFIRKSIFQWAIAITAALSVLLVGSLTIEYMRFGESIPGVIVSQEVTARKGNSISYDKSFKDSLHAGTEFTVLENRGAWLRVKLPDDRTCWVPAPDVELVR